MVIKYFYFINYILYFINYWQINKRNWQKKRVRKNKIVKNDKFRFKKK